MENSSLLKPCPHYQLIMMDPHPPQMYSLIKLRIPDFPIRLVVLYGHVRLCSNFVKKQDNAVIY